MPKFYSSDEILSVLKKEGFFFVSQRGSHIKLRKNGIPERAVILPAKRKEIPLGTFRSILRQANLTLDQFKNI